MSLPTVVHLLLTVLSVLVILFIIWALVYFSVKGVKFFEQPHRSDNGRNTPADGQPDSSA